MPYRHKNLVLRDQSPVTIRIYASEVTDVVPICLKEMNDRILIRVESPETISRLAWPVVTDFVSAAGRVSDVKTVPTVVVVSLPGCVVGLLQDVRMAGIIAHDKNNGARLAGIQPYEFGKINS